MTKTGIVIGIGLISLLGGCVSLADVGGPDWRAHNARLTLSSEALKILSDWRSSDQELMHPCASNDGGTGGCVAPTDSIAVYAAVTSAGPYSASTPEQRLRVDQIVLAAQISNSDASCDTYMSEILGFERGTNTGLKMLGQALSTAGGLTTPVRNANLLSGLSGFMGTTEATLRGTLLSETDPQLIYRAVMAERAKLNSEFVVLLASSTDQDANYRAVLARLAQYHALCGVAVGINALNEAVDRSQDTARSRGNTSAQQFLGRNAEVQRARGADEAAQPAPPPPPPPQPLAPGAPIQNSPISEPGT